MFGKAMERLGQIVEYLAEYDEKVTVLDVMMGFEIDRETYDLCMELALPAIRRKNELRAVKQRNGELTRQLEVAQAKIAFYEKQLEGVK